MKSKNVIIEIKTIEIYGQSSKIVLRLEVERSKITSIKEDLTLLFSKYWGR